MDAGPKPRLGAKEIELSNVRGSTAQRYLTQGMLMAAYDLSHAAVLTGMAGAAEEGVHQNVCMQMRFQGQSDQEKQLGTQCAKQLELLHLNRPR